MQHNLTRPGLRVTSTPFNRRLAYAGCSYLTPLDILTDKTISGQASTWGEVGCLCPVAPRDEVFYNRLCVLYIKTSNCEVLRATNSLANYYPEETRYLELMELAAQINESTS